MTIENGRITMRRPDDFHVHLRQGMQLQEVIRHTAHVFGRALVMPNLKPPVLTAEEMLRYKLEIESALSSQGLDVCGFKPLMTIYVNEQTTPDMIYRAKEAGAVAGKIYPKGRTTHSEYGVKDYTKIDPALTAMQECGMVACFHGEVPEGEEEIDCLDWEYHFWPILQRICKVFKNLKKVLEHISCSTSARWVSLFENLAATVTVHHLILSQNDVIGGLMHPHNFCMPTPKLIKDREAVIAAVLSGATNVFLGTDSASHPVGSKECADCCAGVFSAPVAMQRLAELFERHGALEKMESFCAENGARFYGLPLNTGSLVLEKKEWEVPDRYGSFVPFLAGKKLSWQIVG